MYCEADVGMNLDTGRENVLTQEVDLYRGYVLYTELAAVAERQRVTQVFPPGMQLSEDSWLGARYLYTNVLLDIFFPLRKLY